MELSDSEKTRFVEWLILNVDYDVMPADESDTEGLLFNLVHRVRGDGEKYNYKPSQNEEIATWEQNRNGRAT